MGERREPMFSDALLVVLLGKACSCAWVFSFCCMELMDRRSSPSEASSPFKILSACLESVWSGRLKNLEKHSSRMCSVSLCYVFCFHLKSLWHMVIFFWEINTLFKWVWKRLNNIKTFVAGWRRSSSFFFFSFTHFRLLHLQTCQLWYMFLLCLNKPLHIPV